MASKTRTQPPTDKAGTRYTAPSHDNWDQRLGFLMHDVSRLRRKVFDEVMKPEGITRSQWWVMAYLSRHDGMVQTQLAELLDVGKASLGALLDRLEATDFIERRPEPTDRRAKRVYLTRTSMQLLEKLQAAEAAFNTRILDGISDKDRRELLRLLALIKDSLIAMDRGSPDDNG